MQCRWVAGYRENSTGWLTRIRPYQPWTKPRRSATSKVSSSYYATLELDPRSGQWMADIEGLPVHTWGRTLTKVKQYAREALAVHLDVTAPIPASTWCSASRSSRLRC